jgi:hypothetical protein
MIFAFIVLLLQCNYITNVGNNLKWWEGIFTWIGSFWMVASQHPMRIGLTQIGLRPLVASYSQLHYSNRIAPFGRILFAVALLNALRISSDFILASPCALVLPKALRSSSCCLAFLLFASLQEHSLRSSAINPCLFLIASY